MIGILVFICCVLLLVGGYFLYGRLAEKVYGFDASAPAPSCTQKDGVDYVPLPVWKVFLIQLLNIAGLGPVVGALSGCLFGPVALVWIVLGCIFAGALHDLLSALMSLENKGASLPELIGNTLGPTARYLMRLLCIFLLLMVGVVFTQLPAGMLHGLVTDVSSFWWAVIILAYYFMATALPINALIGRIYPFFGAVFLFMALGLAIMLPLSGHEVLPRLNAAEVMHPAGLSIWPMIFVTIACGAISGFHATQSPLMTRCLPEMRHARCVFYGAMIVEGLVALVWATVGLTLRDVLTDYALVPDAATGKNVLQQLAEPGGISFAALTMASPSMAINYACEMLLGPVGAFFAVLGVVILAITSGDTAMRSCRLMLADVLHLGQRNTWMRLALSLPLFAVVIVLFQLEIGVIWRYFGWANQALACFTLWSIAVHMKSHGRNSLMPLLPALFMTSMCTTFLLYAPECGICFSLTVSTLVGVLVSSACLLLFLLKRRRGQSNSPHGTL